MAAIPTLRGRRLAAELRQHREDAGLTLDEAADAALISKSALSRIENALVPPKPIVLRSLCQTYRLTPAEAERLSTLAKAAVQRGWWDTFGDQLSQKLSVYIGFESEATGIRAYEPLLVPGLLQTREYAEALIRAAGRTGEDLSRAIDNRMRRQERLAQIDVSFIFEESALRRPTGGEAARILQLNRLLEFNQSERGSLQVLPETMGAHLAMDGQFGLLDFGTDYPSTAFVETAAGHLWIEDLSETDRLAQVFEQLRQTALSPEDSSRLIQKYIGEK